MLLRSLKTSAYILSAALFCQAAQADIEIQTIAEGFDTPWSIAELPNGEGFLVTERPGGLHRVSSSGETQSISGVPAVFAKRQGGCSTSSCTLISKRTMLYSSLMQQARRRAIELPWLELR